ncbi:hypothetical protein Tco_1237398 [Tanacetum coccineum]
MDFKSFMLEGVDGELNFLPVEGVSEGRNSPSAKSVNNDAPVIGATPLSSVFPSNIVENVADSDDPSYGEDEQTLALPPKVQKVPARASKVAGEASTPLDVDNDSNIHEFPLAKELRDATDCHWVVAHAVLDNVLNSRTRELISALHKAKTSYDVIRVRELDKDKAYAELERKCNEALQDLEKNPLVSDMRAEIKVLQGQVDGLHSEYSRLILEEKKWEIDSLKHDRAVVVSKVIPDAAMKLVRNDDLGVLIAKLLGYRPSLKEEYDQAGDALANASYPFLDEYVVNPYASMEQLLSKKPPSLRPILSGPCFEPLSSKVK